MTEDKKAIESVADTAPAIGLADLQNAVKIIDHAADQGAFKGWTVIEQVITVRNKLNAFILYSAPKEEPVAAEVEPVVETVKKPAKTARKVR